MRSLRPVDDDDNVVACITKGTLQSLWTEYADLSNRSEVDFDTDWLDWLMNIMKVNLEES